jgi:hypothetical protein
VDVEEDDSRWVTLALSPGDVALYHGLAIHHVTPDRSEYITMGCEYRYQLEEDPVCLASVKPHHFPRIPDWGKLSMRWSSKAWIPATEDLNFVPYLMPRSLETWHEQLTVSPSRFLP